MLPWASNSSKIDVCTYKFDVQKAERIGNVWKHDIRSARRSSSNTCPMQPSFDQYWFLYSLRILASTSPVEQINAIVQYSTIWKIEKKVPSLLFLLYLFGQHVFQIPTFPVKAKYIFKESHLWLRWLWSCRSVLEGTVRPQTSQLWFTFMCAFKFTLLE